MRPVVLANGLLLALVAAAIGAGQLLDRTTPAVEASARRYAAAVRAQDLQAAVAEIAPETRAEWTPWVRGQLGNIYDVHSVSVRWPSVLDRLLSGAPGRPSEVTVYLDVNRGYPEFYQPTTRVGVEQVDQRWYLRAPLLAPEAAGS